MHCVSSSSPRWEVHRGLHRRAICSSPARCGDATHLPNGLPGSFWMESPQAPDLPHAGQQFWLWRRWVEGFAAAEIRHPGAAFEVNTLHAQHEVQNTANRGIFRGSSPRLVPQVPDCLPQASMEPSGAPCRATARAPARKTTFQDLIEVPEAGSGPSQFGQRSGPWTPAPPSPGKSGPGPYARYF